MLPQEIKTIAEKKLRQWLVKNPERRDVSGLIQFMNSQDLSVNYGEFRKWTQFLDKRRNQSINTIIPEFFEK